MKICGIVAEYNPFHNGHMYQLERARELTGADYVAVVMSGSFVQRGAPAFADKYTRARAALACGADLVLELPTAYATESAEYFASGAVSLLENLGSVTHLCFGSECGELDVLRRIAEVLLEEPDIYKESLQKLLRAGHSYPIARSQALMEACPELSSYLPVLSTPNNILGIEYLKAILRSGSRIEPVTLMRFGSEYHDQRYGAFHSSSTALRQALASGRSLENLKALIPEGAYRVYREYLENWKPLFTDDFSALLHYKLLTEQDGGFTEYTDISPALSDRICRNLYDFTGISSFCELLKTKDLTYTRISRCLFHILLGVKKKNRRDLQRSLNSPYPVPYARVLGFRRESEALFHEIDRQSRIPLLTKLADAEQVLEKHLSRKDMCRDALDLLSREVAAADIYSSVQAAKSGQRMRNEYSTPLVILP